MQDEHREWVEELAYLKWEFLANESARRDGIITTAMYEFARDALKKDIAALERLCYNKVKLGGGNIGIESRAATA